MQQGRAGHSELQIGLGLHFLSRLAEGRGSALGQDPAWGQIAEVLCAARPLGPEVILRLQVVNAHGVTAQGARLKAFL